VDRCSSCPIRAALCAVGGRTFYRLPREYHKHLKSTNMLERMDEEIKRLTRVVRGGVSPVGL
jgi:hypothetical protein